MSRLFTRAGAAGFVCLLSATAAHAQAPAPDANLSLPALATARCTDKAFGLTPSGQSYLLAAKAHPETSTCAAYCRDTATMNCSNTPWMKQTVCGAIEQALVSRATADATGRRVSPGSRCVDMLLNPSPALFSMLKPAGTANYPTLLPVAAPGSVSPTCNVSLVDGLCPVRLLSAAPMAIVGGTTGGSALSRTLNRVTPTSGSTALRRPDRSTWNSDGPVAKSCEEYAWEKYYDYSRFEDEALFLGNNYAAIASMAFAPPSFDALRRPTYPFSALGTRIMDGDPILSRAIAVGTQRRPIPYFFDTETAGPRDPMVRFDVPLNDFAAVPYLPSDLAPPAPDLGRRISVRGEVVIENQDLFDAMNAAQGPHDENMAWHRARYDALNRVAPDKFLRADLLRLNLQRALEGKAQAQVDLLTHLAQRRAGFGNFLTSMPRPGDVRGEGAVVDFVSDFGAAFNPVGEVFNRGLGGHTPMSMRFPGPYDRFRFPTNLPDFATVAAQTESHLALLETALAVQHATTVERRLVERVAEADARVESVLLRALAMGCFSPDANNVCTWSPKGFFTQLQAAANKAREDDFSDCRNTVEAVRDGALQARTLQEALGSHAAAPAMKFKVTAAGPLVETHGLACSPKACPTGDPACLLATPWWNADHTEIERFIDCDTQWRSEAVKARNAALASLGGTYSPSNGGVAKVKRGIESDRLGNEYFGAGYYANAEITAQGIATVNTANVCGVQPSVVASAGANVSLLGARFDVLSVTANVNSSTYSMTVDSIGVRVARESGGAGAANFYTVAGEPSTSSSAAYDDIVMLAYIPVHVHAAAVGTLGMSWGFTAGAPEGTACSSGSLGVAAHVTPYADLDLEASAGIYAGIAEAGIAAELKLLHLGVPVKADLAIEPNAESGPMLTWTNSAHFSANALDGRVFLYAEIDYYFGSESWEEDLARWDGLRLSDKELFQGSFQVPLNAMYGM